MEKHSRDRTCFKEGKETFQNAEHMNRSGKVLWYQRDTGVLCSLDHWNQGRTKQAISVMDLSLSWEREKAEKLFPWVHSWEATNTVYYFTQDRGPEVKWKWIWSNPWPGMHLGNVLKERKLGIALSIPVLSRPDLPWFWVQFNFGKEKDEYVCCLGQETWGTLQKQWRRRKKKVLLKTCSMPEMKPRKKTSL